MPDLGQYTTEVLLAYGVTLVLLVATLGIVLRRAKRIKTALQAAEARNA